MRNVNARVPPGMRTRRRPGRARARATRPASARLMPSRQVVTRRV